MKILRKKFFLMVLLLIGFILSLPIKSNAYPHPPITGYSNFTTHPGVTVFDKATGDHLNGPYFDGKYSYARLAPLDGKVATIEKNYTVYRTNGKADKYINKSKWQSKFRNPNVAEIGDIIKVTDVGVWNGKKLVFAMTPVDARSTVEIDDFALGGGAIGGLMVYNAVDTVEAEYEFWVETEDGEILNDPELVFLYSLDNRHTVARYPQIYIDYLSSGSQQYIVGPSDTTLIDVYRDDSQISLSSQPLTSGLNRPFTYGTNQLGTRAKFRNDAVRPQDATRFNSSVFLSVVNTLGVKFPYQVPYIAPTVNKDTSVDDFAALLDVSQELFEQTYVVQYADPLEIYVKETTGFTGYIDFDNIDVSKINVKSRSNPTGPNVGSVSVSTLDGKKVLKITVTKAQQQMLKNDAVLITGKIPINKNKQGLFNNLEVIDGAPYVTIPQVAARNNESRYGTEIAPGDFKETKANLKIKVPGPAGDPVQGISVLEDTSSDTLNPEDLVENLRSVIPGDKVEVVEIVEKNKILKPDRQTGYDFVNVRIKSRDTGLTSDIKVPILVISKHLDILEPVRITTNDSKVTNGGTFDYDPIFEMKVRTPTGVVGGRTTMNNLKIMLSYHDEYLNVNKNTDFKVLVDDVPLSPTYYTVENTGNKNEYGISFKTAAINNQLMGKTVKIVQSSKMIVNDDSILNSNVYQKVSDKQFRFTYPITAYYQFDDDSLPITVKQMPKSTKNKVFNYEPVIKAKDNNPGKVIEPTNQIGEAKDYVTINNDPDFTFDDKFDAEFVLPKPDFSSAGEKTFKVLVSSKAFGYNDEITIMRKVVEPKVKMSIKQVYKDKNTQAIYENLDTKKTVPNDVVGTIRIGEPLGPVIDALTEDDGVIKLNYDWYETITKNDYKVVMNNTVVNTSVAPDGDFELVFEYNGLMSLDVSDLDYEIIETTGVNHKVHTLPNSSVGKNKDVEVINTTLDTNWYLKVSMPKGIKSVSTDKDYLGGLEYKDAGNSDPIEISNSAKLFAKQSTSANAKLRTVVPMNIDLYQNIGNDKGSYKGELHWILENTP